MNEKKLGFQALVNKIGVEYFNAHKDSAVFCWGEEDKGLYCFLGIDLHPENASVTLSADMEDWDIFASCYVKNDIVTMDKCRLP